MQNMIIQVMNQFGYFGIFLLIVIENIFPPIPSEVILVFGGVMTTYTRLDAFFVILVATVATLVGAYILYGIGRFLNKERLKRLARGKIGRFLRFKEENIDMADQWFEKKGNIAVFFCRFIPIVRSLISIPAGMSSMPILKFSLYTTFGTIIWNTVLVLLGSIAGENWGNIVAFMKEFSNVVKAIMFFLLILTIFLYFYGRKNRKGK